MKHLVQTNGEPSGSKTMLVIALAVVLLKYLLSGVTFGQMYFGQFDPSAAGTLIGILAGLYGWRMHTEAGKGDES